MRKKWPLLLALTLYAALFATQLLAIWAATGGQQLYSLDDPYIHAAIAKNLVRHGVYGVTQHEFTFSASSIAWPFLLAAAYLLTGIHAVTPLVLNVAFALLAIVAADRIFRFWAGESAQAGNAVQLCALVIAGSLVGLTFLGMEHTLQVFTCLGMLHYAARAYESRDDKRQVLLLCAWTALAAAARYEGLFLALAVGVLFALARRWKTTLLIGAASAVLPGLFAVYQLLHGGGLLPIPLGLKTSPAGLGSILRFAGPAGLRAPYPLAYGVTLLWLLAAALLLIPKRWLSLRPGVRFMLGAFLITTVIHTDLARFGWEYRYEAYLVAMGAFSVLLALSTAPAPEFAGAVRLRTVVWIGASALLIAFVVAPGSSGSVRIATAGTAILAVLTFEWMRHQKSDAGTGRRALGAYELVTILGLWVLGFLAVRAQDTYRVIVPAAGGIYRQQYQMARFLGMFYPQGHIAANDVGAINFLNDLDCLDLFGLASPRVAAMKARGDYSTAAISELAAAHHTAVAIVYPGWFGGRQALPPNWIRVGTWELQDDNDLVPINHVVGFYAIGERNAEALRRHLQQFEASLPPGVAGRLVAPPPPETPSTAPVKLEAPGAPSPPSH